MAVTPLKVLLFLAGASGAAGGTAYFAGALDPYIQPVALVTAPDGAATAPAAGDGQAADKPAAATTGEEAAKTERVKPAEPAAAKPAPNAAQPTSDGQAEQVAAAPVEPAKPAPQVAAPAPVPPSFDLLRVEPDGSIVIAGRAMPGSSVEVLSGSKALAQVDAGPSGDFVAILDEPLKPGDYQIVLRSTGPATVALTSVETAVVSVPSTPDGQVLALVEQPGAPSKLITAPPPRPVPEKPAEPAVAAAKPAAEPAKPAAPAASQDQAAASPPAAPEPAPAPQAAPVSKDGVAVEAVEIEGRKIFVAGAAPLGATVRIYANELLLGDAKTSPEGRFLLEAERDLKVGDYIIRADVLSKDGSKVLARAAVPFEREPGELGRRGCRRRGTPQQFACQSAEAGCTGGNFRRAGHCALRRGFDASRCRDADPNWPSRDTAKRLNERSGHVHPGRIACRFQHRPAHRGCSRTCRAEAGGRAGHCEAGGGADRRCPGAETAAGWERRHHPPRRLTLAYFQACLWTRDALLDHLRRQQGTDPRPRQDLAGADFPCA